MGTRRLYRCPNWLLVYGWDVWLNLWSQLPMQPPSPERSQPLLSKRLQPSLYERSQLPTSVQQVTNQVTEVQRTRSGRGVWPPVRFAELWLCDFVKKGKCYMILPLLLCILYRLTKLVPDIFSYLNGALYFRFWFTKKHVLLMNLHFMKCSTAFSSFLTF